MDLMKEIIEPLDLVSLCNSPPSLKCKLDLMGSLLKKLIKLELMELMEKGIKSLIDIKFTRILEQVCKKLVTKGC
jgi:hypothetical protein